MQSYPWRIVMIDVTQVGVWDSESWDSVAPTSITKVLGFPSRCLLSHSPTNSWALPPPKCTAGLSFLCCTEEECSHNHQIRKSRKAEKNKKGENDFKMHGIQLTTRVTKCVQSLRLYLLARALQQAGGLVLDKRLTTDLKQRPKRRLFRSWTTFCSCTLYLKRKVNPQNWKH